MGKSRLTDPARVSRLMIAVSLAYIWIIYLGELAIKKGGGKIHTSN